MPISSVCPAVLSNRKLSGQLLANYGENYNGDRPYLPKLCVIWFSILFVCVSAVLATLRADEVRRRYVQLFGYDSSSGLSGTWTATDGSSFNFTMFCAPNTPLPQSTASLLVGE